MLVLLDQLVLPAVASRPDLAPFDLAGLQAGTVSGVSADLTDERIAELLAGVLDDTADAPIEALAGRSHDGMRTAGDEVIARARPRLLKRVGEEPTRGAIQALADGAGRRRRSRRSALTVARPES